MKKIRSILIILTIIFIPNITFASNGSTEIVPLSIALMMEAFVSIHMSVFVLLPLSKLISSDKSTKTFWILFVSRIAILLIFDFFITTSIMLVDFILVFVGAFIILPISMKKGVKIGNTINANKTADEQKEKSENNVEIPKDNSPIVLVDPKYLGNEKALLKNIIKGEIEGQGENTRELTTSKLNMKKNMLMLLYGLLTFVYVIMYFFNISLKTCLICEVVTLVLYMIVAKRYNIINVISKKAKENPNEDIAKIIADVKNEKKKTILPNFLKMGIIVAFAVFVPIIIFAKPKLLYFRYGDGYAVIKYTRGLSEQDNDIVIPDTHNGKNVVAIGANAFKNTDIKTIKLPQNLETIRASAFYGCESLESIVIPKSVTEIRASAFENCSNLQTVSLQNGIVDIRASAFKNDKKLRGVELPNSLEYLGASAFAYCSSLVEITIPSKVIEINGQTFEYCTSLERIRLHDNIISIHGETFRGCRKLNNVVLPSKITEIRGDTFYDCQSLTSIIIPEGVTRIGGHAFWQCVKLSNVVIPSTVNEIGSSAFRNCYELRTIRIPRNALVNERAFKNSPTTITYF